VRSTSERGSSKRRIVKSISAATIVLVFTAGCTSTGASSNNADTNPVDQFQNAVAFQMTPGHTGYSPDKVGPTWTRAWSKNLGAPLSFPLIVGGNVYVIGLNVIPSQQSPESSLYSLNARTGSVNWQVAIVSGSFTQYGNAPESAYGNMPGLAYDDGDLFTVTSNPMGPDGVMSAYKASTGALMWSRPLAPQWTFGPPTALDGMVYTSGSGDSATVYGVLAATGIVAWSTKLVLGGTFSIPAVSASGVYVSYPGQEIYDLSPSTGDGIWKHSNGTSGGGGATPVLAGSYLLTQDQLYGNLVLDASTGKVLNGGFDAGPTPAATHDVLFAEAGGHLQAQTISNGLIKWTFQGDGRLDTSPIVVNHTVYEGSASGMLYAVSSTTGAQQWTADLPAGITGNIAEGDGYLVVPASNILTVFKSNS
jgi:outer membrane protein assembly factor BamB